MSLKGRIALLLGIWAALWFVVGELHRTPIDWESFFPQASEKAVPSRWFTPDEQYLLVCDPPPRLLEKASEEGIVDRFYRLPVDTERPVYLLLFPRAKQDAVLQRFAGLPHAGTVVAAEIFRTEFGEAVHRYLLWVLPLLLLFSFRLFPLRYWLGVLTELSLYLLLGAGVLAAAGIPVDAVAVLAWLFLAIYALTLLNYMHLGEIDRKKLALGIGVSIATTLVSTLYLAFSDFGLVHTFGFHASLGLVLLALFMALRIPFARHATVSLAWVERLRRRVLRLKGVAALATLYAATAAALLAWHGGLEIDLNPFDTLEPSSGVRRGIERFESACLPALPFVVALRSLDPNRRFDRPETARRAQNVLDNLQRAFPFLRPVATPERLFRRFAERPLATADESAWAQFLLAMELSGGMPLFSDDERTLYATYFVSLRTPSQVLQRLASTVHALAPDGSGFEVTLQGKVAQFETMAERFVQEGLYGFLFSFLFVLLFFLGYCKTWRIVPVIFVSALFPIVMFLGWHLATQAPLTLISVIALVLYAGLYADGFIHLFVCYAKERELCIPNVLKPIVVSNLTMLAALAGMTFTGSLLGDFGKEMTVILLFNLLGLYLLLPTLLKRWVTNCNV